MPTAATVGQPRALRGFGVTQMARAAGLSHHAVLRIETPQRPNPTLDTIERLARLHGVRSAWLAFGDRRTPDA